MPTVGCCCCEETKESVGLPDAIDATFAVLSSGSVGLPSDSATGSCGEKTDWQASTALAELLATMTFDYVGTAGGCCWSYAARKSYIFDAGDDNGCGTPFTQEMVNFGDAPFGGDSYRGGNYAVEICTENDPCDPADPTIYCCGDCPAPGDVANTTYEYYEDSKVTYSPVLGDGSLLICLAGTTVTISGTVAMYVAIIERLGAYEFSSGGKISEATPPPPCTEQAEYISDATTVSCDGASPIAEFPFAMSADLALVSGANIWEKIKNCTTWEFDYAYGACGAPAVCWGAGYSNVGPCTILAGNCFPAMPGLPTYTAADDPSDQICLYSYGTLGVTFADGA